MAKNLSDTIQQHSSKLKEIQSLLSQAEQLFRELPGDVQNQLNDFHNEEASLGHCLRWGTTATEELLEEGSFASE